MEIKETKIIEMLTYNTCNILTQKSIAIDGEEHIIGDHVRQAYCNNPTGRALIQEENPEDIVNTVFTMWGDTATLEDPVEELVTE